jgi:hypothetical protein
MRLAFVVRLGNDTRPADGFFEGWVEEVDSYTELRFRSTDELLKFLGDRFDLSTTAGKQSEVTDSHPNAVKNAKRIARAVRRKQNSGGDL